MEHVVFFPAPDGTPAFRRLVSLEEAIRLVEHLRNVEGVSSASVHALAEVPLSFRAYYRVEVPGADMVRPAEAEPEVPAVESVPVLALVEDLPVETPVEQEQPEPALSAGNGHAAPASLGFFA